VPPRYPAAPTHLCQPRNLPVRHPFQQGASPPRGVDAIEPRTLIAYGLIALLVAALIAAIFYLRHNTHDRKVERQRERQRLHREERDGGA